MQSSKSILLLKYGTASIIRMRMLHLTQEYFIRIDHCLSHVQEFNHFFSKNRSWYRGTHRVSWCGHDQTEVYCCMHGKVYVFF